jgi:hypothetical protein
MQHLNVKNNKKVHRQKQYLFVKAIFIFIYCLLLFIVDYTHYQSVTKPIIIIYDQILYRRKLNYMQPYSSFTSYHYICVV